MAPESFQGGLGFPYHVGPGPTEWGEQFANDLKREAVTYINMDGVAGRNFGGGGVLSLDKLLMDVTKTIPNPAGGTIFDAWREAAQDWGRASTALETRGAQLVAKDSPPAGQLRKVNQALIREERRSGVTRRDAASVVAPAPAPLPVSGAASRREDAARRAPSAPLHRSWRAARR